MVLTVTLVISAMAQAPAARSTRDATATAQTAAQPAAQTASQNASSKARSSVSPAAFTAAFGEAYQQYGAGHYREAELQLAALSKQAPANFDVHELLGLCYAAQLEDDKALVELRAAVRLAPANVSARNNLATTLIHAGQPAAAEAEWRTAVKTDPKDYTANRNLARLYLQEGRGAEAVELLEAARQVRPEAADTAYDLALAYEAAGRLDEAHRAAEALVAQANSAGDHALLGRVAEKQARYLDAVNEFSTAAHLDPSEENLFTWAGELMAHRAYEPAIRVFAEGTRRYPASPRLWVGQGMALYARGDYQPSIEALLKATDLNATDPRAYLFLFKAYLSAPSEAEAVIERFRRYAALKPNNAQAQFYYGVSLWKGRRVNTPDVDYGTAQRLLERSIALDGGNADVHLQLGILLNDRHVYEPAQLQFQRAVELDPTLADAHFRLGRAYLRAGDKQRADAEIDRFKTLQAQHQAAVDKERAEVQQFVTDTQSAATAATPTAASPAGNP